MKSAFETALHNITGYKIPHIDKSISEIQFTCHI